MPPHENGPKENPASPRKTDAQRLYESMSGEDRRAFLAQMRSKYSPSQLVEMYGVSPEDTLLYLATSGAREPQAKEEVAAPDPQKEHTPFNRETVHVVETELSYPGHTKTMKNLNEEVAAFIRSACSIADYYKKPYLQILFSNGMAIFEYQKTKDSYTFKKAEHPDVEDDFSE